MRIINLGAFNAYYGRAGDSWDQWCNTAADVWAAETGNANEAEEHRKKCVDCNQKGFSCHLGQEPKTVLGHIARGLPANFSTSAEVVRAGVMGKVGATVGEGVAAVAPYVPQVVPSGPPGGIPANLPPIKGRRWGTDEPPPQQDGGGGGFLPSGKMGMMLPVIAGVGLVAVLVLMKKRGGSPAMAGYSRRRRRRR